MNAPDDSREWSPHVTVAAVVERERRFLIVEELAGKRRVLNQPAGHWEDGESLVEAVIREVREETAWGFDPACVVGLYRWRSEREVTHLRVAFAGVVHDHCPQQSLDDGILAAHWLTAGELAARQHQLRSPLVMRCITDYLSGRRFALDLLRDVQ